VKAPESAFLQFMGSDGSGSRLLESHRLLRVQLTSCPAKFAGIVQL